MAGDRQAPGTLLALGRVSIAVSTLADTRIEHDRAFPFQTATLQSSSGPRKLFTVHGELQHRQAYATLTRL